jgi:hypothetical protein
VKKRGVRDAVCERGEKGTHALDSFGECLGVLQELLGSGLKETKVPLIVVELRICGFWK